MYPGIKIEIKNNILNWKIKLLQYELWDYTKIKTDEIKIYIKLKCQQII